MSEDLTEHVKEARKEKQEFKDDFKEWIRICDEAEVISEIKRIQYNTRKTQGFRVKSHVPHKWNKDEEPWQCLGRGTGPCSGAQVKETD